MHAAAAAGKAPPDNTRTIRALFGIRTASRARRGGVLLLTRSVAPLFFRCYVVFPGPDGRRRARRPPRRLAFLPSHWAPGSDSGNVVSSKRSRERRGEKKTRATDRSFSSDAFVRKTDEGGKTPFYKSNNIYTVYTL